MRRNQDASKVTPSSKIRTVFAWGHTQLKQRQLLQKVLGNSAWQLADKVLRLFGALIIGVWIARYLGPAQFGLLNFAIAVAALLGPIADGGTQSVIVREFVKRGVERDRIVQSVLALRIGYAICATLLAIACAFFLRPEDPRMHRLVAIVALSMLPQAWDVIDFEYQSRLAAQPIVKARVASFAIFSAIRIGLVLAQARLEYFAWAFVGELCVAAIFMRLLPAARTYLRGWTHLDLSEVRYLARTCWPLAVSGLSVMLYMRVDQVMLGQMLGDSAVGVFSAAVRVSESWYFIPTAIMSSVAPALLMIQAQSEEVYLRRLLKVMRLLFWFAVAVAACISLESTRIVQFLYGHKYEQSAAILSVHAWAGVFVALGVAAGPWFINAGLLRLRMMQVVIGAVINVAVNFIVIPRYGALGAAYATLVSQSVAAFLINGVGRTTRPIFAIQRKAILA